MIRISCRPLGWSRSWLTTADPTILDTVTADKTHRHHAVIEQVHADLKGSALAHLPSGVFTANAAWAALFDRVCDPPRLLTD